MTDQPVIAQEPIASTNPEPASFAVDMSEDQAFVGLKAFLFLITGVEISQGQLNRVPEPGNTQGHDFIIMTALRRVRLATNYRETVAADIPSAILVQQATRIDIQLDVYGPQSTNYGQAITTLFRDDFGCDFLSPYGIQPLYCDDGRQMPLVNGEEQYEARWMILASLQANPAVSTPAQFADTVAANIVEVA